jgi:pilus assembly protein CpaF
MNMIDILMTFENGVERTIRASTPVMIGKDSHSDVRISSWRVAKQHAQIRLSGDVLEIEDLGALSGTIVNGKRISIHRPVLYDDVIIIGPCRLHVQLIKSEDVKKPVIQTVEAASASDVREPDVVYGHDGVLPSTAINQIDTVAYRERLHHALKQALDLRRRNISGMNETMLRQEALSLLKDVMFDDVIMPAMSEHLLLCHDVIDEAIGLGPLESLLADHSISEIMVNRYDQIYIERNGLLARHSATFTSEEAVRRIIERMVTRVGRRIDESSPMVDARLADGSRVNAVLPPIALNGSSITIRKFPAQRPQMLDLIRQGTLSAEMADFLLKCVRSRKNIVISGGTGTGKTTLLNILSNGIPSGERVVTIEDSAELQLDPEHCIALEARPENIEKKGRIDIRDLVKNSLRMRPDRIVVGECRGAEAFDMLTAMNTGHEGSLTTLHANSPRDALGRLEAMVLMAGMDLPLTVVREHIGASVDLVVQQTRLPHGRRVVQSITEITGLESGRLQLQEIFSFHEKNGFSGCGVIPSFIEEWVAMEVPFQHSAFSLSEHTVSTRQPG